MYYVLSIMGGEEVRKLKNVVQKQSKVTQTTARV